MGGLDRARATFFSSVDRVERHLRRRQLVVFHHPAYRLPFPSLDLTAGIDPRRADLAVWCWGDYAVARGQQVRQPRPASYRDLALVHSQDYLESLSDAETLARIYAVDASEVPIEETLRTVRTACGGTIEAARYALAQRRAAINTFGGFHHAAPTHGGGFCALNDIAAAIAVLRRESYRGPIGVLDLDAHPPDGLAACVQSDEKVWIGSLSGSDWGAIPGVDDVLLPQGCGDEEYLSRLDELLTRMPACGLVFVIAGGDVLAGDRLGRLRLSLEGVRRRDVRVAEHVSGASSVWLPGGGYHPRSWQILAQLGFILAGRTRARIPPQYDPLASRFARIAQQREPGNDESLSLGEIERWLWRRQPDTPRLLGLYSREQLEHTLARFGVTEQLEHLGYRDIRVELPTTSNGDTVRVLGRDGEDEHTLIEAVLEKRQIGEWNFLFVNWLALRHPRAKSSPSRPLLPGQEAPGLGMAREMMQLLTQWAQRLSLDGIAFRPSWYHTAYSARYGGRFIDSKRQGRFEALTRDLANVPLLEATIAVADGRVRLNGHPYHWEPDEMASWIAAPPLDDQAVVAEREASHFTVV